MQRKKPTITIIDYRKKIQPVEPDLEERNQMPKLSKVSKMQRICDTLLVPVLFVILATFAWVMIDAFFSFICKILQV